MEEITTPAQVISELNRLMAESQKGITALYEQEILVAELDAAFEREAALGLLNAGHNLPVEQRTKLTSPEKQALAKLASLDKKLELDLAKAQQSRIKLKLKAIDSAIMATSVIAKQVELQWRNA